MLKFTQRSDADELALRNLHEPVEKYAKEIERLQSRVKKLQDEKQTIFALSKQRRGIDIENSVEGFNAEIAKVKATIADYKKLLAGAKRDEKRFLDGLTAKAKERAERQLFAVDLIEQVKKSAARLDELNGNLLHELAEHRKLLKAHAENLGQIRIDGRMQPLSVDGLVNALGKSVAAPVSEWAAWITGQAEGMQEYVVATETLRLPETLVRSGLARYGDKVWLSDAEAVDVLRKNNAALVGDHGELLMRVNYSPEAWERMKFEAATAGVSFEEYLEAGRRGISEVDSPSPRGPEHKGLQVNHAVPLEVEEAVRSRGIDGAGLSANVKAMYLRDHPLTAECVEDPDLMPV